MPQEVPPKIHSLRKLPNFLTLFRLAVIPAFIAGSIFDSLAIRASLLTLYCIAAFTDFLDGYLARQYNVSSSFGRIFDPISDKILVVMTLLMVIVRDAYFAKWLIVPFAIIIFREFVIAGIREGLSVQQVTLRVSLLGKYKTAAQLLACGFLVAGDKIFPPLYLEVVGLLLLWVSAVLTLMSGYSYIQQTKKYLKF